MWPRKPGAKGAKFKISRTGKVEYYHHGNTQHASGVGVGQPASVTSGVTQVTTQPSKPKSSKSHLTQTLQSKFKQKTRPKIVRPFK